MGDNSDVLLTMLVKNGETVQLRYRLYPIRS